MERALVYQRLFPGTEAVYDRLLASLPAELEDAARAVGLRDLTVFRRGTDVWTYAEAHPDRATTFAGLDARAPVAEWRRSLATIVAERVGSDGRPLAYEEVFHTEGRGSGPMRRGLFALVVDSDGIDTYDRLHADPWPDMIEAITNAGYRNYSGFRRGNHVVYYGEYYPDIETVNARMAQTEVNGRWNQAFEGVITTITTEDGRLITADEVHHQD